MEIFRTVTKCEKSVDLHEEKAFVGRHEEMAAEMTQVRFLLPVPLACSLACS